MTRNDGLWLFLGVVITNVNGLLIDLWLWNVGYTTVTEFARRNVWPAFVIIGWQVLGIIGLAAHFFARQGGNGNGF